MVGEHCRQGKRRSRIAGMKRMGVLALLALLLLAGCAGTLRSSAPVDPTDWPVRVGSNNATARAPAALGRRNLAWHLASRFDKDEPLARFVAGSTDETWVRLTPGADGVIKVTGGVKDETLVSVNLAPRNRRKSALWNYQAGYTCRQGKLFVRGGFPVPQEEQQFGVKDPFAAGLFTFERAEDRSLVMLEDLYWSQGGEVAFQKWWRWRRLGP
jgi:hypothetical protein